MSPVDTEQIARYEQELQDARQEMEILKQEEGPLQEKMKEIEAEDKGFIQQQVGILLPSPTFLNAYAFQADLKERRTRLKDLDTTLATKRLQLSMLSPTQMNSSSFLTLLYL
jgi:hypothetical protein